MNFSYYKKEINNTPTDIMAEIEENGEFILELFTITNTTTEGEFQQISLDEFREIARKYNLLTR